MEKNYEQAYNTLKLKLTETVKYKDEYRHKATYWRNKSKELEIRNNALAKRSTESITGIIKVSYKDVRDLCESLQKYQKAGFFKRLKYLIFGA